MSVRLGQEEMVLSGSKKKLELRDGIFVNLSDSLCLQGNIFSSILNYITYLIPHIPLKWHEKNGCPNFLQNYDYDWMSAFRLLIFIFLDLSSPFFLKSIKSRGKVCVLWERARKAQEYHLPFSSSSPHSLSLHILSSYISLRICTVISSDKASLF